MSPVEERCPEQELGFRNTKLLQQQQLQQPNSNDDVVLVAAVYGNKIYEYWHQFPASNVCPLFSLKNTHCS